MPLVGLVCTLTVVVSARVWQSVQRAVELLTRSSMPVGVVAVGALWTSWQLRHSTLPAALRTRDAEGVFVFGAEARFTCTGWEVPPLPTLRGAWQSPQREPVSFATRWKWRLLVVPAV